MSYFWMGDGTHKVPFSMHRRHREEVARKIREEHPAVKGTRTFLLMKGGGEQSLYDTDTTWDFRQEANFQYLFGAKEPGLWGGIDIDSGKGYLFIPKLDEIYATWLGPIRTKEHFKNYYEVEDVLYLDSEELKAFMHKHTRGIVTPIGTNLDSGSRSFNEHSKATFMKENSLSPLTTASEHFSSIVWTVLNESRAVKDADEIRILEFACKVSAQAHIAVMKKVYQTHTNEVLCAPSTSPTHRPWPAMQMVKSKEYLSEAEFKYQSFLRGCARVGYTCICPSGENNAVLHYGHAAEPNMEDVQSGEMKLHDMGAEYHCYTSDITVSFPVTGKFTDAQRRIYSAVWSAVQAVERRLRPGVRYGDMHKLAQRTLLHSLKGFVFLETADVEEMMKYDLAGFFMPHGLGHMLGLAVHDVGGYVPGESRKNYPDIKQNLRLNRELKENMVLTVEPGFYFIPHCIRQVFQDEGKKKFMKMSEATLLQQMTKEVGGVRIEDNVQITKTGCRVLHTTPREIEEIEGVMQGKFEWDFEVECLREYNGAAGGGSPMANGGDHGGTPSKKQKTSSA
ncbi:unnamed protein product [Amoebophrya sp. A120]|nr:unnamed protein product [Amoebophrya sp. A120]|eukprot:GSA120T00003202001.1